MKKLAMAVEKLAGGPGGKYLVGMRLVEILSHLRDMAEQLSAARPSKRCGRCRGAGCDHCRGHGWICALVEAGG